MEHPVTVCVDLFLSSVDRDFQRSSIQTFEAVRISICHIHYLAECVHASQPAAKPILLVQVLYTNRAAWARCVRELERDRELASSSY